MAYRYHPLEQSAPDNEQPAMLGSEVVEAVAESVLPALLFNLDRLSDRVQSVVDNFDGYNFPIKANPLPEIVMTAVKAGAAVDVCSPGELHLVLDLGIDPRRICYTGVAIPDTYLAKLAELGCQVHLDHADDLQRWAALPGSREVGLRLQAAHSDRYRRKFGISPDEIEPIVGLARHLGIQITRLHVHFGHGVEDAKALVDDFQPLTHSLASMGKTLRHVAVFDLGGGWPVRYGRPDFASPREVATALRERILPQWRALGFSGQLEVEPGEYVVAGCGYWAAEVALVRERENERVVVLDTLTPIPSAALPYPVAVLRRSRDKRLFQVEEGDKRATVIVGNTNSPFDVIRDRVVLPEIRRRDILVMADTGAYLTSLIGRFNGRKPPLAVILR